VAGAVVLDMAREQQWKDGARWKSRAGWEWGVSGETWFLLNAKAGIRVAVDKRSTWPTIVASVGLWAVEVDGRWRGGMAAHGECSDEATRALG
jgi:hypothetical protein